MQDTAHQHGIRKGRRKILRLPLILILASRNLFHDRVRFVATIVGIVFSVILVTVQLGLYVSCERMITAMIDRARADLWIVPTGTKSFEDANLLDGQARFRALAIPGVANVVPLVTGYAHWHKPDGGTTLIFVVGFDPDKLGLQPWNLIEGGVEDLQTPNGVIVDRSYINQLGISAVGQQAEITGQRVRVVALTNLIRSFTTAGFVFTTRERARTFLRAPSNDSNTYFLVQASPGTDIAAIRADLSRNLNDAEVITPQEFHSRSLSQWLYGTGAGAALIGGAILGVIVGTVIVAQTLYSSTKDHLNEFATLRAIGSSAFYIHQVILSQAFLSALIGFSIAAVLGLLIVGATANAALPVTMTPKLTLGLFVLTVGMCALSAISAIVKVTRIDPAVVFNR